MGASSSSAEQVPNNRTREMERSSSNKSKECLASGQEVTHKLKESYAFEINRVEDYEKYIKSQLNITELKIKALHDSDKIEFKNYWRVLENIDTLQVKFYGTTEKNLGYLLYETTPRLIVLDIDFFNIINKHEKVTILRSILNSTPNLKSLRTTFASLSGVDWNKISDESQIVNLELYGFLNSTADVINLLKITTNIEILRISTENRLFSLAKDRINAAVIEYSKKIKKFDIIHNPNTEIVVHSLD